MAVVKPERQGKRLQPSAGAMPIHRLNDSAKLSSARLRPRRAASVLPGKIISTSTTSGE